MNYNSLVFEREGNLAIITLNRPRSRNALSLELMQELIRCLDDIGSGEDARAVILRATGDTFCSGHDLKELAGRSADEYRHLFAVCADLMSKIKSIPQPVIAQVQGIATAAGCQLVASCDLAVASEEAKFATPGVSIGLFCTTPMVELTRAIGRKRAMEMLLTGRAIDALTAAEWGLINRAVSAEALPSETRKLAAEIAAASSSTIRTGKQAFYSQVDLNQSDAYALAKEIMTKNSLSHDAQEGISAFLERRAPSWRGK